jgi:hypothetical protein
LRRGGDQRGAFGFFMKGRNQHPDPDSS